MLQPWTFSILLCEPEVGSLIQPMDQGTVHIVQFSIRLLSIQLITYYTRVLWDDSVTHQVYIPVVERLPRGSRNLMDCRDWTRMCNTLVVSILTQGHVLSGPCLHILQLPEDCLPSRLQNLGTHGSTLS